MPILRNARNTRRRNSAAAATIHDVAARAGVSVATVSRVLNGIAVVREETSRDVRAAAKFLRYVPNVAARSLSIRRSQTIGIVLPDVHGEFFSVESASVGPRPARPLDIWLGGSAPGALRRVGRLGDGWLASFLTPAEAGAGRLAIEAAAAEAGREIEPDHYGISLAVADDASLPALLEVARSRRSDCDPAALVASGWAGARALIENYVAAGLTKFVVRPSWTPGDPGQFTADFVREMVPLQT